MITSESLGGQDSDSDDGFLSGENLLKAGLKQHSHLESGFQCKIQASSLGRGVREMLGGGDHDIAAAIACWAMLSAQRLFLHSRIIIEVFEGATTCFICRGNP